MKAFHAIKSPWAKVKHSISGNYLPLFANKLARLGSPVYLVDGFAGGGRYGDGQEGSALITANTILHPRTPDIGKVLRCIDVEKNVDSYAQLQEATREHAFWAWYKIFEGNFTNCSRRYSNRSTAVRLCFWRLSLHDKILALRLGEERHFLF